MATPAEQENLAQEERNRKANNISNLSTSLAKGTDTYDVARQIPGVKQQTLDDFLAILEDARTFYRTAETEAADAVATKRDTLEIQIQKFVEQTHEDVQTKKKREEEQALQKKKEEIENQTFKMDRFLDTFWKNLKASAFWLGIVVLALWGGSISSNHAIKESLAIRVYYFIFGAILFPISFLFAFWRWITGESAKGKYHAILAPLVPLPTYWWIHVFLFFFTYKPPIMPQSITYVPVPKIAPEETLP
jgi:hypothetical protein